MYEDYSHEEINQVCETLLFEHTDKLKPQEVEFITALSMQNKIERIEQSDRDLLIAIYDRMYDNDN